MSKRPVASPAPLTLAKKKRTQQHAKQGAREEKVVLERVLGFTCMTHNALAVCQERGCVAYPAGCITVLYFPKKNRQLHVLNTSRKPVSSVCLSPDGKYLATGESGHQPCVRVWDLSSSPIQVAELKGHSYGISCVRFSPNMKYLVSVGFKHDMVVNVWNWKNGTEVARNKNTSEILGLAFSDDGSYFVTVGNRKVKFWYFDTTSREGKVSRTSPLKGRSAILGDLQNNRFVAVVCGNGSLANNTYTLTRSGLICLFDGRRELDRYTEVKASPAHCLAISEQYLFCGCSEGIIRVFDPYNLDYLITLPKPHSLGVNIAAALDPSQFSADGGKYPDTIAVALDSVGKRLTAIYNDHSFYVWDLKSIRQVGKSHSFLYHSACVWDICVYPQLQDQSRALLPESCFASCSSDNTIRFWCLDSSPEASGFIRNIYSKELMKIIYADPDTNCLKNMSKTPGDASAVADMSRGVRSIQFHPNGQHLAAGDRAGNLKVYDLQFNDQIFEVEAHDSEVLSIEYSPKIGNAQFMATASRDRLIHVFTTNGSYQHIQTLDEHSASITAIKFTAKDNLQLLSCGADKSIMFRTLEKTPDPSFQNMKHIMGKATIYDMDIDAVGKHMVTAGQDRVLRIYHVASGKQKTLVKAPTSGEGSLIKVSLDPSGLFAAASSSDKAISLFDFYSGECLARLYGHSEVVTQVEFSQDCKYLYSVSGDSCIFVWRLSKELTRSMHERLAEIGNPVSPSFQLTPARSTEAARRETYSVALPLAQRVGTDETEAAEDEEEPGPGGFRLSMSQLPRWAQRQMLSRPSVARSISASGLERATRQRRPLAPAVEGRWAQRVSEEAIVFASQGQEDQTDSGPKELEVIDLTEDSPAHVTVRGEECSEGSGEEEEEMVIYPTLRDGTSDVDPSSFRVTTPEKPPRPGLERGEQETQTDESDPGSGATTPENSPQEEKKAFDFEEEKFLRTNFISLSAEQVEEFFMLQPPDSHNPRLSISTKFLSRSLNKELGSLPAHRDCQSEASPKLPGDHVSQSHSTERQSSSVPSQAVSLSVPLHPSNGNGSDEGGVDRHKGEPQSRPAEERLESRFQSDGISSQRSSGSAVGETGGKSTTEASLDVGEGSGGEEGKATKLAATEAKASRRRGSIEEEICKTKKRLEELGYSVPARDSDDKPTGTRKTAKAKPRSSKQKPAEPSDLAMTKSWEQLETEAVGQHPRATLLERAIQLSEQVNESFRALVALHEEATERMTTEDPGQAISTIATAVKTLKTQSVALANKHRKLWRGKEKGGYALRSTPSRDQLDEGVSEHGTPSVARYQRSYSSEETAIQIEETAMCETAVQTEEIAVCETAVQTDNESEALQLLQDPAIAQPLQQLVAALTLKAQSIPQ